MVDNSNQTAEDSLVPWNLSRPGSRFPPEIWQQIFERSIMPANLIDCFASHGKHSCLSLDAEHKRTLMAVCKEWNRANKWYLYEHIDLYQPNQLLALNRSLKSSTENAGLVKRLHIRCYVSKEWNKRFSTKLQDVVDRLPNLIGFYLSNEALEGTYELPRFKNVMQELQTPWPLRDLWLLEMDPGSRYHNTANFWGLQSLSLSVEPTRWFLPAQISRNLELPMLEHFELSSSLLVESDHIKIIACWNLPGLKRLTITFFGMPWVLFTEPLNLLLSKHGRTVEELQVAYNCTRTNNEPPEPLDLTPLCPNLRHLVLHWEQWQRMSHHNVHWVDIWLPWLPTNLDTIARWQTLQHELVQSKMFPSLLGTRMLDIQLTSSKNVPFDLPPYSVQDQSDAFEINFMGYTIHQDEGMIRGSWLWDDASDDSDYESDSESPSESSSEEDSSDSDNESTFFEAGSDIEQEESFFPLM